jgi:fatty acid desaturase
LHFVVNNCIHDAAVSTRDAAVCTPRARVGPFADPLIRCNHNHHHHHQQQPDPQEAGPQDETSVKVIVHPFPQDHLTASGGTFGLHSWTALLGLRRWTALAIERTLENNTSRGQRTRGGVHTCVAHMSIAAMSCLMGV